MSGRLPLPRAARALGDPPEEAASSSANARALPAALRARGSGRLTRSWKLITSVMLTLTVLLIGFRNHVRLHDGEPPPKRRPFSALFAEYGSRLYKYQARLRMPRERLELLRKESQALENNLREIRFLTQQIDVLKALLRDTQDGLHHRSRNPDGDPAGAPGPPETADEGMSDLVNYVLRKLREDQVQMADYALQSAGASIIEAGTSESYRNDKAKLHWRGIGFLSHTMPPDVILQPDVHPGKCWAFPGSRGQALIKLARKILPKAVTMEHISERVSPSGNISSAPQEFSVYGILKQCQGEEVFLGQFVYDKTGATVQTFELQHGVPEPLLCVKLNIRSNWGHRKYTCVYRFRVHGTPEATPRGAATGEAAPGEGRARAPHP